MASALQNNFTTLLTEDAAYSDTQLTIYAEHLDRLRTRYTDGDYLTLTLDDLRGKFEIVLVTAIHPTLPQITVERGYEGSGAEDWNAGTILRCQITAGFLENIPTPSSGPAIPSDVYILDVSQQILVDPANGPVQMFNGNPGGTINMASFSAAPAPITEIEVIIPYDSLETYAYGTMIVTNGFSSFWGVSTGLVKLLLYSYDAGVVWHLGSNYRIA